MSRHERETADDLDPHAHPHEHKEDHRRRARDLKPASP